VPTSTPRSTATWPTPSIARRAARRRSSSRSAPAWCSSSKRPWAGRRSAPASTTSSPARSRRGRQPQPAHPRQQGRVAAVDRVVRGAPPRRVPAPQLRRRAAERSVRHPGPRRLLVRRALRPPPARDRSGDVQGVRARDRARLRGHQAGLGAGQLQLLPVRDPVPVPARRDPPDRHRRLEALARLHVLSGDRAVAAPARAARRDDAPGRRHLPHRADGVPVAPRHRARERAGRPTSTRRAA
jgi:hypothetical protein